MLFTKNMLFTKINESKTHNPPSRVDTFAAGYNYDFYLPETVTIPPNIIKIINTNIRLNPEHRLNIKHQENKRRRLILLKSSDSELFLCGGGVIDSDFTGEIKVRLLNTNKEKPIVLNKNTAFITAIPLWYWEDMLEPSTGKTLPLDSFWPPLNSHENEKKPTIPQYICFGLCVIFLYVICVISFAASLSAGVRQLVCDPRIDFFGLGLG
jgi:dUTPase